MTDSTRTRLEQLYWRPGFLLRRAHQLSVGIFEDECSTPGLTPAQFSALTVLGCAEGIDQSTLARALGFDRVTTLHLLRGLQQRGLVQREQAAHHARRLSLSLTERGRDMLQQSADPAQRAMRRQLAPLTRAEQDQFLALLRKLCSGLDGQARTPLVPPPQDAPGRNGATPATRGARSKTL
jgi:MarR family transcriptional regulator, lower aerobic nicotinate degradation pathway regulator